MVSDSQRKRPKHFLVLALVSAEFFILFLPVKCIGWGAVRSIAVDNFVKIQALIINQIFFNKYLPLVWESESCPNSSKSTYLQESQLQQCSLPEENNSIHYLFMHYHLLFIHASIIYYSFMHSSFIIHYSFIFKKTN